MSVLVPDGLWQAPASYVKSALLIPDLVAVGRRKSK
ncbi:hypothetical protein J2S00_002272 [Caldalkalibacillus uzonensis]|uniref:Uncharacterized protein n=1 Tax=Caldalkalibacillus uzonensis TaxID=353224 RepID=A0ABU0CUA9_9BACI|nr:hypothetical protein [Caldalkalibacillus uzonensis]